VSVVGVYSVKGAPGATTTAMLLASLWPRPAVLIDADPAGGDVAVRLPAPDGRPLDPAKGLLTLLPGARRAVSPEAVLDHAQEVLGGGRVIAGVEGPEQAAAAESAWIALGDALRRLPTHDAVVDLGRLDSRSPVLPLAARVDVALAVVAGTVAGVYSARTRLAHLRDALPAADGSGPAFGFVVRGTDGREAESAGAVIRAEVPEATYLGRVATDASAARLFDGQQVSRPERTMLVRSGAELVAALDGLLYMRSWSGAEPAAAGRGER
jgi:MinD-like ATPase involved in chromosome partitioning or flagellar assembly